MGSTEAEGETGTPASLSTQLVHELRRRIILGYYPQGTRLVEQYLAQELAVSRIPLREALPQLEAGGFVRMTPRRGAFVFTWTKKVVTDLFDVRLAIEPAAARAAAVRCAAGHDAVDLLDVLDRSVDELHDGDDLRVAIANTEFHEALVAASGNELLSDVMRRTGGRMTWLFYLTKQRDPEVACREHRAIAEAIRAGNAGLASALAYAHIEAGREPTLATLRDLPDV
jgi:DNA-binding GntR family transcriptional regulator